MSWASDVADKAIGETAKGVAKLNGDKILGRKRTKEAIAAIYGGTHGMQYQHSRNRGMSGTEAQGNALTQGFQFQQYRAEQKTRVAEDNVNEANAAFERTRVAEEARARGQIAARVRRGGRSGASNKSGTLATGPGGLGSTGAFGSFAALLGL